MPNVPSQDEFDALVARVTALEKPIVPPAWATGV
jgi:hypothetical protein